MNICNCSCNFLFRWLVFFSTLITKATSGPDLFLTLQITLTIEEYLYLETLKCFTISIDSCIKDPVSVLVKSLSKRKKKSAQGMASVVFLAARLPSYSHICATRLYCSTKKPQSCLTFNQCKIGYEKSLLLPKDDLVFRGKNSVKKKYPFIACHLFFPYDLDSYTVCFFFLYEYGLAGLDDSVCLQKRLGGVVELKNLCEISQVFVRPRLKARL